MHPRLAACALLAALLPSARAAGAARRAACEDAASTEGAEVAGGIALVQTQFRVQRGADRQECGRVVGVG
eukprot:CAMPEP_0179079010 /NCGR_PEP_ID=MMETSP0796-20121207/35422_1 /TAXON_ID=73915 /ORGANISM="Pyrodinium bahamense, Strain pbaha01" /LENGTH=69 /DNA_ID=CAMNT_0020776333 /DNA_START=10 /DNA_END=216 /DNA_ORIENTATION=-